MSLDFPVTRLIRYHPHRMSPPIRLTFLAAAILTLVGCSNSTVINVNAPDTALARSENDRAFDLIKQSKYKEAQPYLDRSVAADPYFGPAHNNLGLVHYHLDSLSSAGREFEAAIKYMPNQPDARNNLGMVYERLNKLTDAIDYYERATARTGPSTPEFFRLFMVPGMFHCGGGPGPSQFDALATVVDWVEHNRPPARIVATATVDGKPVRTRPLCPHPQVAKYKGAGSPDEESSFTCAAP